MLQNKHSHQTVFVTLSPLQDERRVGLTVARVVDMDGVSTVGSELAQCSLAATHALCQTAAGACHT